MTHTRYIARSALGLTALTLTAAIGAGPVSAATIPAYETPVAATEPDTGPADPPVEEPGADEPEVVEPAEEPTVEPAAGPVPAGTEDPELEARQDALWALLMELLSRRPTAADPFPDESTSASQGPAAPATPPSGGAAGVDVLEGAAASGATLQTPNDDDGDGRADIAKTQTEIQRVADVDPNVTPNADGSLTVDLPTAGAKTANGHGTRYELRFPDFRVDAGGVVNFSATIERVADAEIDVNVAQLLSMDTGKGVDLAQVRFVQSAVDGSGDVVLRVDGRTVATLIRGYQPGTPITGSLRLERGAVSAEVNGVETAPVAIPGDVQTANGKVGAYGNGPAAGTPADATTTVTVTEASQDSAGGAPGGDPVPPRRESSGRGGDPVPPRETTAPVDPTAALREGVVVN